MQNAAIEMHWLMVNHVSRLKKAEKPKMLVWRTEFGRGVFFLGKLNKPCGYWFCQKWLLIISKRPKKSSEWCYFNLTPPTDHGYNLRRFPLVYPWFFEIPKQTVLCRDSCWGGAPPPFPRPYLLRCRLLRERIQTANFNFWISMHQILNPNMYVKQIYIQHTRELQKYGLQVVAWDIQSWNDNQQENKHDDKIKSIQWHWQS